MLYNMNCWIVSLIFFYSKMKEVSTLVNVALQKPAYLSSTFENYHASYGVDGSTAPGNMVHASNTYPYSNWFVVDLLHSYQVKYIILYDRSDINTYNFRMNNFIVGLTNDFDPKVNLSIRGNYDICGQWPTAALLFPQPMKVNCNDENKFSRYVIIQQSQIIENTDKNLGFSELEVYSNENFVEKYFGCFKTFQTLKWYNESTIESCLTLCDISNMNFSAIKNKTQCHCGTPSGASLPLSQCNPTCDTQGVCAGFDTYAVFIVKPVSLYLGCYVDTSDRDFGFIQVFRGTLTIEMCLRYCSQNNFLYAALQYSYECLCGYSYGKYGKAPESDCNNKCDGNQTQICGGGWRNSVYFLFDAYGTKKSSEIYNCANENIPIPGIGCESGKCEPGWKEKTCDKRDCRTNNGDCGIHQCMDYNMGSMNVSECVCEHGYHKSYFNDDCTGVDECLRSTDNCNKTIPSCINTPGSFNEKISMEEKLPTLVTNEKSVMIAFIMISILFILSTIALAAYIIFLKRKLSNYKNVSILAFDNKQFNLPMNETPNPQRQQHSMKNNHDIYCSIDGKNPVEADDAEDERYEELRHSRQYTIIYE